MPVVANALAMLRSGHDEERLVGLQALDDEARDGFVEKVVAFVELDDVIR